VNFRYTAAGRDGDGEAGRLGSPLEGDAARDLAARPRPPVVGVKIPVLSFKEAPRSDWQSWLLVRRDEAGPALTLLRGALPQRKTIQVKGGRPMSLPDTGYDWDGLVLDDALQLVREDFEIFLARERMVPAAPAAVPAGLFPLGSAGQRQDQRCQGDGGPPAH
jgi:hypothetical protein